MNQIIERIVEVKDYITKSNLPASDFVINPYIGCPHACKYCYACFMKRFTGHYEEWGDFIDIKVCNKPINAQRLNNKTVFLASVTDCYNEFEKKYCITQKILKELVNIDCKLTISTKSKLILRDIELLKRIKNLVVAVSINTIDEQFRSDMDHASSIAERIETLQLLHKNNIYTVVFVSPIFPMITDYRGIIQLTQKYVDEYWFENLNLRGKYKTNIMEYIAKSYSQYYKLYCDIYQNGNNEYWEQLGEEIGQYCAINKIKYKNYFYHKKLVHEKLS